MSSLHGILYRNRPATVSVTRILAWWKGLDPAPAGKPRIAWVDAARGIAILAVFFGHYLQDASTRGTAALEDDLRFLYSFHVPFFFLLSGCLAHREATLLAQARVLATRRLLPVLFFGLCFACLRIAAQLRHGDIGARWLEGELADYLIGRPLLDWATWFLVCLFVCEMLAYALIPHLRKPAMQIAVGVIAILVGASFGNHSNRPAEGIAYYVGEFWFFSEAIVALGFYLIGHALWPWLRSHMGSLRTAAVIAAGGFAVVLATFRLNMPGGKPLVVMMAARTHGIIIWFLVTALAGSLALMATGALASRWELLGRIGRNTIPLLGLNGLFFGFLNLYVVRHLHTPDTHAGVVVMGIAMTTGALVICLPLVAAMRWLVPQLIGSPRQAGPLLPALE